MTGSMSANTGRGALVDDHVGAGDERERGRDHLVAVADADGAQREVQPGRPARDGAGVAGADARARTPLELGQQRPERQPAGAQHLEHALLLGLAEHRARERDRLVAHGRVTRHELRRRGPSARRVRPNPHPVLERVDERLPRGLDDVLRDADRAPHLVAVGGVEQHPRDRAGALGLVEDADLEVDEVDVREVRDGSRRARRAARGRARSRGRCPRRSARSRSPSIQILIVASVSTRPSARFSTIARQDSSRNSGSYSPVSLRSSSSNDPSAASKW